MSKRDEGIDRRQFLITSSTAAAVAWAVGPATLGDVTGEKPSRFAVGFVRTDDVAASDGAVTGNVRAARRSGGDGTHFASDRAAVTILGITAADGDTHRTSELIAHFEIKDGDQRVSVPYRAWGSSRDTGCAGKPVSFSVPLSDSGKVSLSLVAHAPQAKAPVSRRSFFAPDREKEGPVPVTLSLRGERGTTKLMRGYYVIVPLYGREREPRWSSYRLRKRGHGYALENVIDSRPARFEHAVVRIAPLEEQA